MKPTKEQLHRALKNLVAMNLQLDPFDASRPQIKAAVKLLKPRSH